MGWPRALHTPSKLNIGRGRLLRLGEDSVQQSILAKAGAGDYWRFDESSGNAVGQINATTLTAVNAPGSTVGRIGAARSFVEASEQAFTVAQSLPTDGMTLACWVKIPDAPPADGFPRPVAIWENDGGGEYTHSLSINSARIPIAEFYDGGTQQVTGTTALALNSWHHLAYTVANDSDAMLYVNGVLEGTPAAVGTLFNTWSSGPNLRIGRWTTFTLFLDMVLDELLVVPAVLSADEIRWLAAGNRVA